MLPCRFFVLAFQLFECLGEEVVLVECGIGRLKGWRCWQDYWSCEDRWVYYLTLNIDFDSRFLKEKITARIRFLKKGWVRSRYSHYGSVSVGRRNLKSCQVGLQIDVIILTLLHMQFLASLFLHSQFCFASMTHTLNQKPALRLLQRRNSLSRGYTYRMQRRVIGLIEARGAEIILRWVLLLLFHNTSLPSSTLHKYLLQISIHALSLFVILKAISMHAAYPLESRCHTFESVTGHRPHPLPLPLLPRNIMHFHTRYYFGQKFGDFFVECSVLRII